MSNQPENEMQAELEATKQAIVELNDEQLEQVSGGGKFGAWYTRVTTDIFTLGLAEPVVWQTKAGKESFTRMKQS
jgi:hypothetical protein